MSTVNSKRMDNIESLIRTITGESNRLIKEVKLRSQASSLNTSETPSDVPWREFEARATQALGFSDLGWKAEFERQTGLREGVLKICNQKAMVPLGYMYLCDMLKPTKLEKQKARVQADEKDMVFLLHSQGKTVAQMRKIMNDNFGDRRDYLADGPILGILHRLGLKANKG